LDVIKFWTQNCEVEHIITGCQLHIDKANFIYLEHKLLNFYLNIVQIYNQVKWQPTLIISLAVNVTVVTVIIINSYSSDNYF